MEVPVLQRSQFYRGARIIELSVLLGEVRIK